MPEYDPHQLSRRQSQIMKILYDLEEASVRDVRERLPDPPGASAVRKMLDILERKGLATYRVDGVRHVYRPVVSRGSAGRNLLRKLVDTFFDGSTEEAVAALLDVSDVGLTPEVLERLQQAARRAQEEN